jgi:DNA-binding transcriptional regulator YdaS (Cro superfamily)
MNPGERLRAAIRERGLTQTDLAARLAISIKTCNHYIRGYAVIPPRHYAAIYRETGLLPHEIDPDLAGIYERAEASGEIKITRRASK